MDKNKATYKLIGFYENHNDSGKIKLKLVNSNNLICCYIEDTKLIEQYLCETSRDRVEGLRQYRN